MLQPLPPSLLLLRTRPRVLLQLITKLTPAPAAAAFKRRKPVLPVQRRILIQAHHRQVPALPRRRRLHQDLQTPMINSQVKVQQQQLLRRLLSLQLPAIQVQAY